MRRVSSSVVALAAVHCLAGGAVAQSEQAYHPHHVIAWFRPGVVSLPAGQTAAALAAISFTPQEVRPRLEAVGATTLGMATPTATAENLSATDPNGLTIGLDRRQLDLYLVELADTNVAAAIATLNADTAAVVVAEPDWLRHTTLIPNDPLFFKQWGLYNTGQYNGVIGADIHAVEAWDRTTGTNPVDVVVIDTGCDFGHPDLRGKVIAGPNYVTPGPPYDDDAVNSHGTSVSGLIGAIGNNGEGIAGVNWGANIIAVKAGTASGVLPASAIQAAVDWARTSGYRLVNMSFSGTAASAADQIVFKNAFLAGMGMFAATGNGNDATVNYPAGYWPHTIAVGAAFNDGLRWNDHTIPWQDVYGQSGPPFGIYQGSSYGPHVRFVAPGGRFIETTRTVATGSYWALDPYGGLPGFGGTSAAAPLATGVASLVQSVAPSLTGEDLAQILLRTAEDVKQHGLGFDIESGYGLINSDAALAFVTGQNRIEHATTASVADVARQAAGERTIIGWPGIPSGVYFTIRHTIRATVPFTTGFLATPQVWARRASSYGAGNENPVNANVWVPDAWVVSADRSRATLETYVYELFDVAGRRVSWWPTSPSGVRLALTAIGPVPLVGVDGAAPGPAIALSASPNPARTGARLQLVVPSAGEVTLRIHDLAGRVVRELESGPLAAGAHAYRWDLRGTAGERVGAGLYFARLTTPLGERRVRLAVLR